MKEHVKDIVAKIENLKNHKDIVDKSKISQTYKAIGDTVKSSVFLDKTSEIKVGDDAAAILQGDESYLLFASEGIVSSFLEKDPWFAGYSAVMVNISDICAMGGLPIAVTDTLYAKNTEDSKQIWGGMLAATQAYGVPIVGGHTCYHSKNKALSVSILGKATNRILSSFEAHPGEMILLAIDHKGNYFKDYSFWNASTTTKASVLQNLTRLPYEIANKGWSKVSKDVSMGGIIGTLLMLLHTSEVGAKVNIEAITKPKGVAWEKWLSSFPSYGYLFTCKKEQVKNIQNLFTQHEIQCDEIGSITHKKGLIAKYKEHTIKF